MPNEDPKVLALIPARGGSKGIPDKNLRPFAGRSLLAFAVDAARMSGVVDRIVVSTDSERIAEAAATLGAEVPFLRPAELAEDATPMLPVVQHAIRALETQGWSPEVVILLQPTAPLRRQQHLRESLRVLLEEKCDSVVSVVPIPAHLSPHYAMRLEEGRLVPYLREGEAYTRRQDVPLAYYRDGTVYTFWAHVALAGSIYGSNCRPVILSASDSVTVDAPSDWQLAESRLRAGGG